MPLDPDLPKDHLPRLPRAYYQGDAAVHWTLVIQDRQTGWLSPNFHALFRELLLHACAREDLISPVYTLMPDHLHIVLMGVARASDQLSAMTFLHTQLNRALAPVRLQKQSHDHVLRERQRERGAFSVVCRYILENAVRGGLSESVAAWPYSGCLIPGYPRLHPLDVTFWQQFWTIYAELREPDAGNVPKPPWMRNSSGRIVSGEK
jgi:REP element-mobilizing transposase RayT